MSISRLSTFNKNSSSGQLTSLAYNGAVSSGSLLLVWLTWNYSSATIPTVTDTIGNGTFELVSSQYDADQTSGWALYAAVNAHGSGPDTINISYGPGAAYTGAMIEEFAPGAGYAWSLSPDGSNGQIQDGVANGGTDVLSSGSFNTVTDGDLVFCATGMTTGATSITAMSPGTGYSAGQFDSNFFGYGCWTATEYLIQFSHGAAAGTWSPTGTGLYFTTVAAAFKVTVSGGGAVVPISKGSLGFSPQATHVNEALAVAKVSLGFTGKSLTALSANVVLIAKAALAATGQALHVNEALVIAKTVLSMAGKGLHANEALLMAKAALAYAGKALHANEMVSISNASMSFAGKSLTALGATIVAIAAAVMGFTGKSLSGIVGLLRAVKAVYLNVWSMWSGKPRSRGL